MNEDWDYILDTDMVSLYQRGLPAVLQHREIHALDLVATTIITVEEQISGWYKIFCAVHSHLKH